MCLASPSASGSSRASRLPPQPAGWAEEEQSEPRALGQSGQTLPLPAPEWAPSTRIPWSPILCSLSASSLQVLWGAVLPEGPGVEWAPATSAGVGAEAERLGIKCPRLGGQSGGPPRLRKGMCAFGLG